MSEKPKLGADGLLHFAEVAGVAAVVPGWLNAANDEAGDGHMIASLRPPRIPREGLEFHTESIGRISSVPPVGSVNAWLTDLGPASAGVVYQESVPPPEPTSSQASEPPLVVPRGDTMSEQLNPRADEEAIVAIGDAVARLMSTRQQALNQSEDELVDLVRLIATRVIARELAIDPAVIRGAVVEGLSSLSADDRVMVRLGEFFSEVTSDIESAISKTGVIAEVVIDPTLGEYGCQVETRWGRVDESLERRLHLLLEGVSIPPPPKGEP